MLSHFVHCDLSILEIIKGIATTKVFKYLRPEHFKRLLEETHIRIGQHVLMTKFFDDFKSLNLVNVHTYIPQVLTIVHHCNVTTWKQRVKVATVTSLLLHEERNV